MWFKDFQDGLPGGAILDSQTKLSNSEFLCCSDASHQVSAQSKLQCGRICHLKNFKMAANVSWISEQNNFSNSESLCCCDASHQVLAQSDLRFWEMLFEEFQDGSYGCHLGYQNGTMLAILDLYNAPMPPIKFWLNLTWFGRRFQDGCHIDIRTESF